MNLLHRRQFLVHVGGQLYLAVSEWRARGSARLLQTSAKTGRDELCSYSDQKAARKRSIQPVVRDHRENQGGESTGTWWASGCEKTHSAGSLFLSCRWRILSLGELVMACCHNISPWGIHDSVKTHTRYTERHLLQQGYSFRSLHTHQIVSVLFFFFYCCNSW